MADRVTLRRQLGWTAFVVLLCSVVASVRVRHQETSHRRALACAPRATDSTLVARFAADTIATLRGRTQRVRRFTVGARGVEVRTEDADSLSAHDGGLAAFDCHGRLTFLWLDGG